MENPRLVYRVILKTMLFLGLLLLLYVLFSSLFINNRDDKQVKKTANPDAVMSFDLSDMYVGKTRKINWNGKQVLVLKASDAHYYVYYNTGDSGNCPLYYSSNVFKDTCTSTIYSVTGREIEKKSPKRLSSPPYSFKDSVLYLGNKNKE